MGKVCIMEKNADYIKKYIKSKYIEIQIFIN